MRLALLATMLAACSTSLPSGPQGVAFAGEGVRFTAPVGWHVEPTEALVSGGHWLVYLSPQQVQDQCAADPSAPCPPPLEQLTAGGVLIGWYTINCAGPDCTLPEGELTRVGGREAVIVGSRDSCGAIGQTEETDYVVTVSPQRIDTIVICGRAVTQATQDMIRSFLATVVWRTP